MKKIPQRLAICAYSKADRDQLLVLGAQLARDAVTITRNGTEYTISLLVDYVPPDKVLPPWRFVFELSEDALAALHLNNDPRFDQVTYLIKRAKIRDLGDKGSRRK
ncbi:MAG: hypothetical protein ACNJA3_28515 (plasmid) [Pseudomonas rhizophila]|uniref:hypothetical protein n=1 Tax=Pseudomonas rhizophila TaxID=2045200 RepID=UPI003F6B86A7